MDEATICICILMSPVIFAVILLTIDRIYYKITGDELIFYNRRERYELMR
jgi:hypothetical protein